MFQTNTTGHYANSTRICECKVMMRMTDSAIIDTGVDGNVCPAFISALRKWAGGAEAKAKAKNYLVSRAPGG
ncbi:hypothetical protein N7373_04815 [Achromobacter mucicolens]|uniref:hypothetical protein n=1 Tax=Achromobacter mucicolens TaxID=1389922 RepID=UPI00244731E7|nr:hypothetical protein [Achromobacter mucicolens]MDH0090760.1 hypothetical protein [Achromobacter mucicolens]